MKNIDDMEKKAVVAVELVSRYAPKKLLIS